MPLIRRTFVPTTGALAALLALAIVGCGGRQTGGSEGPAGAQLFATYCSLCHGERGEGYAADNANALSNPDFLASVSEGFLREAIKHGRPGTAMAGYAAEEGGPLSDLEVDELVRYVLDWRHGGRAQLPEPGDGDAERAAPLYAERCARCHGDAGQGHTAMSLANPRFLATANPAFIRYAIARGRTGTEMPAFEGELDAQQIDDLVALLRSWARPVDQAGGQPQVEQREVVLNPDGPHPRFILRDDRFVPARQLHDAYDEGRRMIIIDARAPSDYLRGHIPGAINVPYYEAHGVIPRLPRDGTWIIAYCACPHAESGRVVDTLREAGFDNTAVLDEGIFYWDQQGWPMTEPVGPE